MTPEEEEVEYAAKYIREMMETNFVGVVNRPAHMESIRKYIAEVLQDALPPDTTESLPFEVSMDEAEPTKINWRAVAHDDRDLARWRDFYRRAYGWEANVARGKDGAVVLLLLPPVKRCVGLYSVDVKDFGKALK